MTTGRDRLVIVRSRTVQGWNHKRSPLTSISTVCSAIFLTVFSVVNAAAYKSATAIGARSWVALLGAVGCLASLIVLLVRSSKEDPVGLIVLAALLASALTAERLVLRRRRQPDQAPA